MAKPKLDSAGISLFCESVAMMLAAGIQTDEAVGMLSEDIGDVALQATCESVYGRLCAGDTLAVAMKASGAFPRYAVDMVGVGEASGRLEEVLRSLGVYYDEEDRLFAKIRSSVGYPAALLCIMSIILAFTVIIILPVFEDVYVSMAGSLTDGSSGAVGVSVAIGWVALGITLICAIVAVGAAIACRSEAGRIAVMHLMEKFPATRPAMEQLAVSRFASALAAYTASGINTDEAMRRAIEVVEHEGLKVKATAAYGLMIDAESPRSLRPSAKPRCSSKFTRACSPSARAPARWTRRSIACRPTSSTTPFCRLMPPLTTSSRLWPPFSPLPWGPRSSRSCCR